MTDIQCYQINKLRIRLYFTNTGYDTIPKNTPVAFYDADPRKPGARRLGNLFYTPEDIPGKCATVTYTYILDAGRPNVDTLFAVFNDKGTTLPLALPNTTVFESNYGNNVSAHKNFQYHVRLNPANYSIAPGKEST